MKKYWIFLAVIAIISYGCKQRVVTQPEAQQPGQQESLSQKDSEIHPGQKLDSIGEKDISSKYLAGQEGMFNDVLFDYDKYDVKDMYKPIMKSISSWMIKNTSARLLIEGHCDDRGTNEYNLALGDRRAKSVKDSLVSLGVQSARIDLISFGEEKPLCTEQTEDCLAKNRRAHFVIMEKGK